MSGKSKQVLMLFILLLLIYSCSLFDQDDHGVKSPRDYEWTVDTLAYPGELQTIMRNLWGSSSNDVYAVGHCTSIYGTMWHFDGKEWAPVILAESQGGNIRGFHLINDIIGFSSDNIFAVGTQHVYWGDSDSSMVIHYNGIEWQQIAKLGGKQAVKIYGTSDTDLWVGCMYGELYHFNGADWTSHDIPVAGAKDTSNYSSFISIVGNSSNNYYAIFYQPNIQRSLIHFNGSEWQLLEQFPTHMHSEIWLSPDDILYSVSDWWIMRWNGSEWDTIYENEYALFNIYGMAGDNIIATGYNPTTRKGVVLHYNGIDWKRILEDWELPEWLPGTWGNNKHIFISGYLSDYPNKTVIYHGR